MTIYCTYLTVYSGNKLPMFYIGYTTLSNISKGYHGSVSSKKYGIIWKYEIKNNPELFRTIILTEHETIKDAMQREHDFQKSMKVHKNELYINSHVQGTNFFSAQKQSPETISKRVAKTTGKKRTEDQKKNLAKSKFGENNPAKREDVRIKISQALTGRSCPQSTKEKIMKRVTDGNTIYNSLGEAAIAENKTIACISFRAKHGIKNWSFV